MQPLVTYRYSAQGDLVAVVDRLGQVRRQFEYREHLLTAHTLPGGVRVEYTYDRLTPSGHVLRSESSTGERYTFEYQHRRTLVTDQLGRQETYEFNERKEWTGLIDALGGHTVREVDAFGNLIALTDPAGRTTRYAYDGQGRPTRIQSPGGEPAQTSSVTLRYDDASGQLAQATDPLGAATRYAYDERGNLIGVTDALGHTTGYQHDARGLPIVITDASGKAKHLAYNAAGQLIRYTDCSGQSTQYGYDGWGHLSQITDALSQSTRYTHDALGHLLAVQHPDGAVERFDYDTAGRLIAYTDPLGATTRYELAADGLPITRTNAEGGQLVYEYDGARRLKTLLNENRARYDFGYDALDRLTLETGFDARHTRYRYDPTGLIEAKLEAGTLTAEERLAQQHQADGTTPIPPQRSAPTFEDPWGLGLSDADAPLNAPPGQQIATRYRRDAAGRLITKQVAGHVLGSESTLTPQHKTTRYRWDEAGRLIEATNSQGSKTTLAYDLLGQLTEETRTGQGLKSQLRHQYDALGNRIQTELPNGQHLSWLYYGSGHLHQISLDGHTLSDIERDALHRETLRTQGVLQSRYGYDALGRLTAQAAWRMAPGRRND